MGRITELIQKQRKRFSWGHTGGQMETGMGTRFQNPRRYSFKMFKFEINVVAELLSKIIIWQRKV